MIEATGYCFKATATAGADACLVIAEGLTCQSGKEGNGISESVEALELRNGVELWETATVKQDTTGKSISSVSGGRSNRFASVGCPIFPGPVNAYSDSPKYLVEAVGEGG